MELRLPHHSSFFFFFFFTAAFYSLSLQVAKRSHLCCSFPFAWPDPELWLFQ